MRVLLFFFFNDTATTEIYTLSLHDALPISGNAVLDGIGYKLCWKVVRPVQGAIHVVIVYEDGDVWRADPKKFGPESKNPAGLRSEEHTSELQSHSDLVCRLLLEKKKKHDEHRAGGDLACRVSRVSEDILREETNGQADDRDARREIDRRSRGCGRCW